MLNEGDPAPDFDLETDTGRVRLSDLKGRIVVLYFYPKDDTPGCTKEAIGFSEKRAEFEALGATVVGVSKDSAKSHGKFREKYGLDLVLGSSPDNEMLERYGVWIEKSMYGRTYMGIDRATFLIDAQGLVRRVWRKVKVPGHADAVLEAARSVAG
ncbi:MAG TPA: peroxiredoxin [Caulobacteraceae bacterium]